MWRETHFRTPRTGEKPLRVKFRNGMESRFEYVARQLRFSDTGHEFDIVAVRRA